ncbi:hypothetical protein IJ21_46040 [Paenibacillus sp. 32O-W]|nr:hypothetical protein IJ21_46040 [Paenibacillus sp. 32O-W]
MSTIFNTGCYSLDIQTIISQTHVKHGNFESACLGIMHKTNDIAPS